MAEPSQNKQSENKKQISVKTIPNAFYGGIDPKISFEQKETVIKPEKPKPLVTAKKQDVPPNKSSNPTGSPTGKPVVEQKSKAPIIIAIIIFLLLVLGGISWWFFRETTPDTTVVREEPPEVNEPVQEPPEVTEPDTSVTTSTFEEDEEPNSLQEEAYEFPRLFFVNSVDLDADSLTDAEEEVFGTDPGIWDTDEDGYFDGQEIVNLYNPTGFAPIRLIDSGLISEYRNPRWQYRLYYPQNWMIDSVDDEADQVLVSSSNGDYIEIHVSPLQVGETFQDWFVRRASDQLFTDLIQFETSFDIQAYKRRDDLVSYFVGENEVYVLIYQSEIEDIIAYRHIMEMITNSFRPNMGMGAPTTVIGNESSSSMNTSTQSTTTIDFSAEGTTSILDALSTTTEMNASTSTQEDMQENEALTQPL